jgi:hypothetical protein
MDKTVELVNKLYMKYNGRIALIDIIDSSVVEKQAKEENVCIDDLYIYFGIRSGITKQESYSFEAQSFINWFFKEAQLDMLDYRGYNRYKELRKEAKKLVDSFMIDYENAKLRAMEEAIIAEEKLHRGYR